MLIVLPGQLSMRVLKSQLKPPLSSSQSLRQVVPAREQGKHPATKSFQAIRIRINKELEEIANVLPVALHALCDGGRLLAISFHSLEDRIVKRFMRDEATR